MHIALTVWDVCRVLEVDYDCSFDVVDDGTGTGEPEFVFNPSGMTPENLSKISRHAQPTNIQLGE